jgi:tRNA dimethylallyltransferase
LHAVAIAVRQSAGLHGVSIVAVFGATASGKSAAALELADRLGGEIVSADAMQLYAGLPILSNQPSAADRAHVPHHLIGIWPLTADGDVARYAAAAHAAVDDIVARGRVAIVAGGTGLYLRAALADLELPSQPPTGLRERISEEYDLDPEAAYARLEAADPEAAGRIHRNDRRRVVRALELAELGESLHPAGEDRLWTTTYRHPTRIVGLRIERAELHRRIAARTASMFAAGVVDEVRAAVALGEPSATAARALGLTEVRDVIAGITTAEEACRRLIERTRQYARRQEIWMRRIPDIELLDPAAVAHLE